MTSHRPFTWWLAVSGAAILLLYIPNGLLHFCLGRFIYGRDLALGTHLGVSLIYFIKNGHFPALRRGLAPLGVFLLFFVPLFSTSATVRDGLVNMKNVFLWSDAMCTGYLIFAQGRLVKTIAALAVMAFLLVTLDSLVGLYELRTNSFFLPVDKTDETDAGVRVARSTQLAGMVRAQGLQRDVFSFANFMGLGVTACLAALVALPRGWWPVRIICAVGVPGFCYVVFYCGGRSALFGIALVMGLFALAVVWRRGFMLHARKLLAAAVLAGLVICFVGLGPTLRSGVSLLSSDSRIFNLASTYERDAVWAERVDQMHDYRLSYATGMPAATWLNGWVWPVYFVDNQVLWLIFHTGLAGAAMLLIYFGRMARPATADLHPEAYIALVFFMAMVFGEGIARDTLFMFSAVPMFLLSGYFLGADAWARGEEEEADEPETDEAERDAVTAS